MAVNQTFHTSNLHSIATERSLYSDLIKEAIQIYGHDVYYMDRSLVAEDTVWGEDSLSKYRTQHPIEMYMEDADGGFAGEKELMNQFGLQNLSEATFVVNKERFQELDRQMQIEDGTDTSSGGSILLEAGTIDQSSDSSTLTTVTGDNNFYILQDTAATDSDRPQEGDVIYHPVLDKMFQINFVDHDEPFYQLDNNPVYKMRCRLYDYSSEIIDTGISDIDAIETEQTQSALIYQFTLEQASTINEYMGLENEVGYVDLETATDSGYLVAETDTYNGNLLMEDGAYVVNEEYVIDNIDTEAKNEFIETEADLILDFTEKNPFGEPSSLGGI